MKTNKALILAVFCVIQSQSLWAHDLPIKIKTQLDSVKMAALENALNEVSSLLPSKVKAGLPTNLVLKIEKLSDHTEIPSDVCTPKKDVITLDENLVVHKQRPFVYGEYDKLTNSLVLNLPVLNEFVKGRSASVRIDCQHKSLYDQAISTIIHELTHAYDFKNKNVSNTTEFIRRADFKKGLLRTKLKNVEAMRSADPYELVNIAEAYAVNMEYFTMDPEFACRKPSMFDYYKRTLEVDPFPNRTCTTNNTVMMSTTSGFYPMKLDPSRVYRVDYLLAAPGKDLSSGFGHSMFRLVMCAPERFDPITNRVVSATPYGPKCLDDKLFHLVVSYRANVEDATLSYLKGLFGGYPSMLFILNFGDVLDEYNRDELRDVVAYPLNLSVKEKEDFINKVLEEHWNYRGSYKFFTNNCAVESFDLLKSSLDRPDLQSLSALTPKGVLEDLDKLSFLSLKSGEIETYKARTEQLILAYREAYGYRPIDAKQDKKMVQKFIDESSTNGRMTIFNKFTQNEDASADLHTEVTLMKKRLVVASSFSVMEQQILRTKTSEFRKKAADLFMNSKDEKIKKLMAESGAALKQDFKGLSTSGYGVPLADEMLTRQDMERKLETSKETMSTLENTLKEMMPKEFAMLNAISANIGVFNEKSLAIRKNFREKLDVYTKQVIKNLTLDDQQRNLLISALTSKEDLDKVRDLLDRSLVSDKEILDVKLRRLIQDTLGN